MVFFMNIYGCFLCAALIDVSDIARRRPNDVAQCNCPECGFYFIEQSAQANINNLKAASVFGEDEIIVFRQWIANSSEKRITQVVLRTLFPKSIQLCEEKFSMKMN